MAKKKPQQVASVDDVDEWARRSNETLAAREEILRDPRLTDMVFSLAAKEMRRPRPPVSRPSRHTDADILNLERQCVRKFQALRGREPLQRELHSFISNATGLEPLTCRDRLLKAWKNKS
jgi:hypothetical protein